MRFVTVSDQRQYDRDDVGGVQPQQARAVERRQALAEPNDLAVFLGQHQCHVEAADDEERLDGRLATHEIEAVKGACVGENDAESQ